MNNRTKFISAFVVLCMLGAALVCIITPVSSEGAPLTTSTKTVTLDGSKSVADITPELQELGMTEGFATAWDKSSSPTVFHMSGINFETSASVAIKVVNGLVIDVVGENTVAVKTSASTNDDDPNAVIWATGSGKLTIKSDGSEGNVLNVKGSYDTVCDGIYSLLNLEIFDVSLNVVIDDISIIASELTGNVMSRGIRADYAFNVGSDSGETNVVVSMGDIDVSADDSTNERQITSTGIETGANQTANIKGNTSVITSGGNYLVDVQVESAKIFCISRGSMFGLFSASEPSVKFDSSNGVPKFQSFGGDIDFTNESSISDFSVCAMSVGINAPKLDAEGSNSNVLASSGSVHAHTSSGIVDRYAHSYGMWLYYGSDFSGLNLTVRSGFVNNDLTNEAKKEASIALLLGNSNGDYTFGASVLYVDSGGCAHSSNSTSYGINTTKKITTGASTVIRINAGTDDKDTSAIGLTFATGSSFDKDTKMSVSGKSAAVDPNRQTQFDTFITSVLTAGKVLYLDSTVKDAVQAGDVDGSKYVSTFEKVTDGIPFALVMDLFGFVNQTGTLTKEQCVLPDFPDPEILPEGKTFVWVVTDSYGNSATFTKGGVNVFSGTELVDGAPLMYTLTIGDAPEPSGSADSSLAVIVAIILGILVPIAAIGTVLISRLR